MPFGPHRPYQSMKLSPGNPASAIVGTDGSCGTRCSDMTAKARRLPAWICCKALPSGATMSVVCPPMTSVRAGAVPR